MLNPKYFDSLLVSQDGQSDSWLESTLELAKKFPLLSKDPPNCTFNVLKVINPKDILTLSKSPESTKFIKDPCLTLIVIFEDFQDLESSAKNLQIPLQPYFFATVPDIREIFEVQTFSRKIFLVNNSDANQRRADFNGQQIRITRFPGKDSFWKLFPILQKRLNFTVKEVKNEGYGALINGKWSGAIKQLINSEIDMGQ